MNQIVTEMAVAGGIGGAFQFASELLKMGHSVTDIFKGMAVANNEQYRENQKLRNASANDAAKRSPAWLRAILAIIVFVAAFVLIFVNGWTGTLTSIVTYMDPWLNLGIFKLGGGAKVTEANGFVMTPEFWQTVRVVAFFFFGVGAVRTGKKIL